MSTQAKTEKRALKERSPYLFLDSVWSLEVEIYRGELREAARTGRLGPSAETGFGLSKKLSLNCCVDGRGLPVPLKFAVSLGLSPIEFISKVE